VIALVVWFCLSGLLLALDIRDVRIAVLGWVCFAVGSLVVVEKGMKIPSRTRVQTHYTAAQITFRAMFGGTVIAFAVLMGKVAARSWAGYSPRFRPCSCPRW